MIFKVYPSITYKGMGSYSQEPFLVTCPDWESAEIAAEIHVRQMDNMITRISLRLDRYEAPQGSGVMQLMEHKWKDFVY